MTVQMLVPAVAALLAVVILTTYYLRSSRIKRQDNANIRKRRDLSPPLTRRPEPE